MNTALNDFVYNFEPLEIFVPEMDYRVNEAELQRADALCRRVS